MSGGETCRVECHPKENYVIKQFKPRKEKFGGGIDFLRGSLDLCFYRELTCLQRLTNYPQFPKVLAYDQYQLWIKMQWVGRPYLHHAESDKQKYISQVDAIVDALEKENIMLAYQLTPGSKKLGYCLSMMMVNGYDLSIIDFERAWPLGCDREHQFNTIFKQSFESHDNNEFKKVMKDTISITELQPREIIDETE